MKEKRFANLWENRLFNKLIQELGGKGYKKIDPEIVLSIEGARTYMNRTNKYMGLKSINIGDSGGYSQPFYDYILLFEDRIYWLEDGCTVREHVLKEKDKFAALIELTYYKEYDGQNREVSGNRQKSINVIFFDPKIDFKTL